MDRGFIFFHLFVVLAYLICRGDCRRCFQCHQASTPQGCGTITQCNSDENCFTEQFVTSTGNVVFNSGCSSKAQCSSSRREIYSVEKRVSDMILTKRKRDISICKECCSSDYCNIRGCGVSETPREQRGPYCFHCDGLQDPSSCRNVLLCSKDEVCGVYTKTDDNAIHTGEETRSTCLSQSRCNTLMQSSHSHQCATICCMDDFCNDHCGKTQNSSVTVSMLQKTTLLHTSPIHKDLFTTGTTLASPYSVTERRSHSSTTTTTTTRLTTASTNSPSTTRTVNTMCDTKGGYIFLADESTQTYLCVHLSQTHARWHDADKYCINEGGHLVILDTLKKSQLLRRYLIENSDVPNIWIGAVDYTGTQDFKWVNEQRVEKSEADWDNGKPDNTHRSCITMERHTDLNQMYKWNDRNCHFNRTYICERPLTHGDSSPNSQISSTPVPLPSTIVNSHTSGQEPRCDTRGGYIDLQSRDGHSRLCIHIIFQHVTWKHAQTICQNQHGHLVILDTREKSHLLRLQLDSMHHRHYWIGASYTKQDGNGGYFERVNHHQIDGSKADWGQHESHRVVDSGPRNCVASNPRQGFHWYAEMCDETLSYICERNLVPA